MNDLRTSGLIAAVALAAGVALAVGTAPGPRIHFEAMTHDFGDLRSDRAVSFAWKYDNRGDEPLRITGTRPQCGCTATAIERHDVPPGGSGTLQVTFDPAGLEGTIRKSLAVMSNDPTQPTVLLTLRARVERIDVPLAAGAHPPTAGRSLLSGDCVSCHATPAAGKSGETLYAAVCAMCHGSRAEGSTHGPSLRNTDYLGSRSDEDLRTAIAFGTANPRMPGFSTVMGGPLDDPQIDSLVRLVRSWGPLPATPPAR